jgi:NADPH-dependent 2,4-dienoyl-CoA reductase/sulfur reductase-like enzyme
MQATAFDVAVVGAGPAGLSAATAVAARGLSVAVFDEQTVPGGQIFRNAEGVAHETARALGRDYRNGLKLIAAFRESGARYFPGCSVVDCRPGEAALMVVGADGAAMVGARHTILACGARERVVPFSGWTLDGVMTVGAAQVMLKDMGVLPAGRTVVAGSGPLVFLVADQLLRLGVRLTGVLLTSTAESILGSLRRLPLDVRALAQIAAGLACHARLLARGVPVVHGVDDWRALGDVRITAVEYTRSGKVRRLDADLLLCHDGLIPAAELAAVAGCWQDWDAGIEACAPRVDALGRTAIPGLWLVGDCAGIAGSRAAILRGRLTATAVSQALGAVSDTELDALLARSARTLRRDRALQTYFERLFPLRGVDARRLDAAVVVCRCEQVTAGQIRRVLDLGCAGPNQIKALTRCGMGPCQGRMCANTLTRMSAEHWGMDPAEIGGFRVRAPIKPVNLGDLSRLSGLAGEVELDFGGLPEARSQRQPR